MPIYLFAFRLKPRQAYVYKECIIYFSKKVNRNIIFLNERYANVHP